MQPVKQLSVALRQAEQAHRNLRLVQVWAGNRNHLHLEQGMLDLVHRMARLSADLLRILVYFGRYSSDGDERPIARWQT